MGVLLIVLVASALISLGIGRYALSLEQILQILTAKLTALPIDPIHQQVIFQVRLPRILSALCVGAGLALSGAALQGIFRNPLVDPHIIGVTSGSAFGGCIQPLNMRNIKTNRDWAGIFGNKRDEYR